MVSTTGLLRKPMAVKWMSPVMWIRRCGNARTSRQMASRLAMPEVKRLTVCTWGMEADFGQWSHMVRYDVSMLKFPRLRGFRMIQATRSVR